MRTEASVLLTHNWSFIKSSLSIILNCNQTFILLKNALLRISSYERTQKQTFADTLVYTIHAQNISCALQNRLCNCPQENGSMFIALYSFLKLVEQVELHNTKQRMIYCDLM